MLWGGGRGFNSVQRWGPPWKVALSKAPGVVKAWRGLRRKTGTAVQAGEQPVHRPRGRGVPDAFEKTVMSLRARPQ